MVNRKKTPQLTKTVPEGQEKSSQTKKKKVLKTVDDVNKTTKIPTAAVVKEEETGSEAKGPNKRTQDDQSEGVVVQSSGRISKRPRKEYDPYSPPGRQVAPKKSKTPETRKRRKHREVWTAEDKTNFFEAVKEHGRDWKGLYEYFGKHRKRGELQRSQEHIRQLYYRIWHKIVKFITCPPSVDKQVVEIFGLICYGEMRKRIGSCIDAYSGAKLNEMVHKGTTLMKWKLKSTRKIKTFRLKTPQCTILKKLNSLEGLKYPKIQANPRITLPQEVCVELRPHSNASWTHVQSLSQNPRLRTRIDPSKRLSSIMDFLYKKWQPHRVRIKEGMNEHGEVPPQELKFFPAPKCSLSVWDLMKFNRFKEAPRHRQINLGLETYLLHLKNLGDCSPSGRKGNKRTATRKPSVSQDINESAKGSVDGLDISGDLKVKCEGHSNNKDSLRTIAEQEDNDPSNSDNLKVFSKFGLDSNSVCVSEMSLQTVTSISSPVANENQTFQSERPLPMLMSPPSCDRALINPLASLISPSTYDSTKDSHCSYSLNSEPQDTRSELSSSPETGHSLSTKQSTRLESESVLSGIGSLGEEMEAMPANEEITEKITMFQGGLNRAKADLYTLADLYLMMGHPDKIILEYEWTDIVDTPDILDLSHVTNMLRRLIHLASSEFTIFNKTRLPAQLKRTEDRDEPVNCICGATTQLGTPPHARSARNVRARVKREPATPRGGGRDLIRLGVQEATGDSESVSQTGSTVSEEATPTLPPGLKGTLYPGTGNQSSDHLLASQDVFKVPAAVAPRSVVNGSLPSPITINNIAQKLSPNALLEHINKANSHVFARRRRNVRKPLIVHRKIMPKPTTLTGGTTYIVNQQPSVISGPQPRGNVKVMHPADVTGLTIKSIIPDRSVTAVHDGQNLQVGVPESSQSNISAGPQVSGQSFSTVGSTSTANSQVTTISSSNGQVPIATLPVLFDSFVTSSELTSTQTSGLSLISQVAMATGISMETGDNNAVNESHKEASVVVSASDNMVSSIRNPVLAETSNLSTSDLSSNLSALLDISMPEPAGAGDTTERMIDMALANSSSSFSVSALLDTPSCGKNQDQHTKDPTLNCARAISPGNLSPGKSLKTVINSLEEYDFSLSSFLAGSPLKKVPMSTPTCTTSAASTVLSTPSLLTSESSRDSVRFDVDIALQSMLNDNSMDYVSKFADLANEIAAATTHDDRSLPNVPKQH